MCAVTVALEGVSETMSWTLHELSDIPPAIVRVST
jgi:hypothetical protein